MTKLENDDRVARLIAAAEAVRTWAVEGGDRDAVLDALDAALKPLSANARRVHHPKRGHDYVVGGVIEMQVSNGPYAGAEGKLVQVYHAEDGKGWGRFVEEFEDGRFLPAGKERA
jgi:hypothetical protein